MMLFSDHEMSLKIQQYLKQKYHRDFIVNGLVTINYWPSSGIEASVHEKTCPQDSFLVQRKEERNHVVFQDDYYKLIFCGLVQQEIEPYIKQVYPKSKFLVEINGKVMEGNIPITLTQAKKSGLIESIELILFLYHDSDHCYSFDG